jgi:hypothetical protein
MKKALLKSLVTIFILMQMCSCTPPLYYPNAINAPNFSKKGQFAMNISGQDVGGNVQLASAAAEKVAFQLNMNWGNYEEVWTNSAWNGSNSNSNYKDGHSHRFGELGAGYYNTIGTQGRFDVFGLVGFGNANSYTEYINYKGNYKRYSLQGDLGFETKAVEGIISARTGYLSLNYQDLAEVKSNQSGFYIDPAVTLRVGWKAFKIFIQFGFDHPFNTNHDQWVEDWVAGGLQLKL